MPKGKAGKKVKRVPVSKKQLLLQMRWKESKRKERKESTKVTG